MCLDSSFTSRNTSEGDCPLRMQKPPAGGARGERGGSAGVFRIIMRIKLRMS
jgi:hypothetical protein